MNSYDTKRVWVLKDKNYIYIYQESYRNSEYVKRDSVYVYEMHVCVHICLFMDTFIFKSRELDHKRINIKNLGIG